MPGLKNFKDLYTDPRFVKVSAKTKTDIINTIGIDVNDAKDDVANKKYTKTHLTQALHYLLATEAQKENPNAKNLIVRESSSSFFSSHYGSPFYFSDHDAFLWFYIGRHSGSSGGYSSSHSSNNDCKGEGAGLVIASAIVCAAGCCCAYCMNETFKTQESENVKYIKAGGSTLVGLTTFIALMYYLNKNDILRSDLVADAQWSNEGYRTLLFLMSAAAGFLASGIISTINNAFPCLPEQRRIPTPSKEVLEALESLSTVKDLLKKGWRGEGDDQAQCNDFTRQVILNYIDAIAVPEANLEMMNTRSLISEVPEAKERPASPSLNGIFSSPSSKKVEPSAPPLRELPGQGANDHYINLEDYEGDPLGVTSLPAARR